MVWFLVEVLLALAVLVGAVWWTMSHRRPDEPAVPPAPVPPAADRDPPGPRA